MRKLMLSVVKGTNIEERHLITVLYNCLCALNFLHSANILHRDIKPGNILIDIRGNWHLCDFDSCRYQGMVSSEPIRYTRAFHPSDSRKFPKIMKPSRELDRLLLVITVLERLKLLSIASEFTIRDIAEAISTLKFPEFAKILNEILSEAL